MVIGLSETSVKVISAALVLFIFVGLAYIFKLLAYLKKRKHIKEQEKSKEASKHKQA
ncbi:hypothetical protein KY330_01580 [Candidatus Woesearchaeota archaeon]|nr:hypothetical protein [Candidatus Woesearchaeota archaeon]